MPDDAPLKVGVTGLGFSRNVLKNYVDAPETELVLLHDINEELLHETADKRGVPRRTTSFDEVLASDIDILDISTPNQLHCSQAMAAMESGKHVLCQKPMASSLAECRQMISASRKTGKTLGLFMSWHGNVLANDLREACSRGLLGDVTSIRVRNAYQPFEGETRHTGWRSDSKNVGGGVFMQLGVHPLSLALHITGREVTSVFGMTANLHSKQHMQGEDMAVGLCELDNGGSMIVEASYSSTGRSVEIYGTGGRVVMIENECFLDLAEDFEGREISYRRAQQVSQNHNVQGAVLQLPGVVVRGEWNHPEYNQNRAFARAIRDHREPPVSAESGLRDVAIAQALYRSSQEKRRVSVKEMLEDDQ